MFHVKQILSKVNWLTLSAIFFGIALVFALIFGDIIPGNAATISVQSVLYDDTPFVLQSRSNNIYYGYTYENGTGGQNVLYYYANGSIKPGSYAGGVPASYTFNYVYDTTATEWAGSLQKYDGFDMATMWLVKGRVKLFDLPATSVWLSPDTWLAEFAVNRISVSELDTYNTVYYLSDDYELYCFACDDTYLPDVYYSSTYGWIFGNYDKMRLYRYDSGAWTKILDSGGDYGIVMQKPIREIYGSFAPSVHGGWVNSPFRVVANDGTAFVDGLKVYRCGFADELPSTTPTPTPTSGPSNTYQILFRFQRGDSYQNSQGYQYMLYEVTGSDISAPVVFPESVALSYVQNAYNTDANILQKNVLFTKYTNDNNGRHIGFFGRLYFTGNIDSCVCYRLWTTNLDNLTAEQVKTTNGVETVNVTTNIQTVLSTEISISYLASPPGLSSACIRFGIYPGSGWRGYTAFDLVCLHSDISLSSYETISAGTLQSGSAYGYNSQDDLCAQALPYLLGLNVDDPVITAGPTPTPTPTATPTPTPSPTPPPYVQTVTPTPAYMAPGITWLPPDFGNRIINFDDTGVIVDDGIEQLSENHSLGLLAACFAFLPAELQTLLWFLFFFAIVFGIVRLVLHFGGS